MNEQDAIKQLLTRYTEALHAKDAAALTALYDEQAVGFELAPPLSLDGSVMTDPAYVQQWFDTWDGPLFSEACQPTLKVSGSLGFCYALIHFKGRKADGHDVDFWFRSTMGFSKESGEWKVIHVHDSVPFAMDGSFKALVDLKPETMNRAA